MLPASRRVRASVSFAPVAAVLLLVALAGMPGGFGSAGPAFGAILFAMFGIFIGYVVLLLTAIVRAFVEGPRRWMWRVLAGLLVAGGVLAVAAVGS